MSECEHEWKEGRCVKCGTYYTIHATLEITSLRTQLATAQARIKELESDKWRLKYAEELSKAQSELANEKRTHSAVMFQVGQILTTITLPQSTKDSIAALLDHYESDPWYSPEDGRRIIKERDTAQAEVERLKSREPTCQRDTLSQQTEDPTQWRFPNLASPNRTVHIKNLENELERYHQLTFGQAQQLRACQAEIAAQVSSKAGYFAETQEYAKRCAHAETQLAKLWPMLANRDREVEMLKATVEACRVALHPLPGQLKVWLAGTTELKNVEYAITLIHTKPLCVGESKHHALFKDGSEKP